METLFTQINALRKNGQLEQAQELVESIDATNMDAYLSSAAFWVYRDICKIKLEQGQQEEASQCFEKCNALMPYLNDAQGYCSNALNYLQRNLSQMASMYSRAKSGNVDEPYAVVVSALNKGMLPDHEKDQAAWIIFYYLKYRLDSMDSQSARKALRYFLKIEVDTLSMVYSQMLYTALKVSDAFDDFNILSFLENWGFDSFKPEDWQPYRTEDGHTYPSLAEKAISKCIGYCRRHQIEALPDGFETLLETALKHVPGNETFIRTYASILADAGKADQAKELISNLMLTDKQWYLWGELASYTGDSDERIAYLCKALKSQPDENFTVGVILRLSGELIDRQMYSEALFELGRYDRISTSNGWRHKAVYYSLLERIPEGESASENNDSLYSKYLAKADSVAYKDYPLMKMAFIEKCRINVNGKTKLRFRLLSANGISMEINPNAFGIDHKCKLLTCFDVRYATEGHKRKALSVVPSENDENMLFKTVIGSMTSRIDKRGKKYSIVGGCYMPERFIEKYANSSQVKVDAISSDGNRWLAYSVTNVQ